jgi:CHAT domain-containing protein
VSDQQACDLMVEFMHQRQSGMSVVHALGEARRGKIERFNETASPFGWSAYGVTIRSAAQLAQ